jgi:hypothetical protein
MTVEVIACFLTVQGLDFQKPPMSTGLVEVGC